MMRQNSMILQDIRNTLVGKADIFLVRMLAVHPYTDNS